MSEWYWDASNEVDVVTTLTIVQFRMMGADLPEVALCPSVSRLGMSTLHTFCGSQGCNAMNNGTSPGAWTQRDFFRCHSMVGPTLFLLFVSG